MSRLCAAEKMRIAKYRSYRFENQINSSSGATLEQCEAMVISLKRKYPHEYKVCI